MAPTRLEVHALTQPTGLCEPRLVWRSVLLMDRTDRATPITGAGKHDVWKKGAANLEGEGMSKKERINTEQRNGVRRTGRSMLLL